MLFIDGANWVRATHTVFHTEQTPPLQPRIGYGLQYDWGCGHLPVAVAADTGLDRRLQARRISRLTQRAE